MSQEKNEINELPFKYLPMGAWATWGWSLVYSFPIIGFIFLCINSLRSSNIARRNHARSYFCVYLIVFLLLAATFAVLYYLGLLDGIIEYITDLIYLYS